MIVLKNILVATDFSEPSDVALRYGRAFAEAFDASLHVLHVIEDFLSRSWGAETYIAATPGLREEMEIQARAHLDGLLSEEVRRALKPTLVVATALSPYLEIVRYATDAQIDLIIMGTHGRGPVAHMLMGSVAEKVVRKAPCPVLTVRHPQHEFVTG